MSLFRKILLGLAAVVVIGAAIGAGVYYFTKGLADAATGFFATVATSGPQAAYAKASTAFQRAMSESAFADLAARAGLSGFKSASWATRKVENGQGSVSGTITLDKGVSLPVTVQLTKDDDGEWRVFNFTMKMPGAGVTGKMPAAQASTGGDVVSAEIGGKPWMAQGSSVITLKLGNAMIVNTAPIVVKDGKISMTTLRLQFDGTATGVQKLGRDCKQNAPCPEMSTGDDHYKIDDSVADPATLTITSTEGGHMEGVFSAAMVSLDGKTAIHDGHFALTVK